MGNVTVLRPKDRVCQDTAPVAAIYRDLGTAAAEQVVTRALSDLAMTMSGLSCRVRAHDLADLNRHLRHLQSTAEHLGLTSLGLVAGDVRCCLDTGDTTAFSAVWARLVRIAEQCLLTEPDLADRSV
jgi:hypothetical protein